ncbi:MAG: hypothetical protein EOO49_18770 [Flavobacterium sp.]|nr:MAG: hypothetical protein EOO49_18770 [Flavobacterium sp.]
MVGIWALEFGIWILEFGIWNLKFRFFFHWRCAESNPASKSNQCGAGLPALSFRACCAALEKG